MLASRNLASVRAAIMVLSHPASAASKMALALLAAVAAATYSPPPGGPTSTCDQLASQQWLSPGSLSAWRRLDCRHVLDDGRRVPSIMVVVTTHVQDKRNAGLLYTAAFRQRQLFSGGRTRRLHLPSHPRAL